MASHDVEASRPPVTSVSNGLEEVEREDGRLPFLLTKIEAKLLGIAGVGFFIDAYDLFIINQVSVMLQWRLYGGKALPTNLEGLMKAGANIGAVIGQFLFGYLADAYGRKAVYGKELMVIIFGTIMTMTAPTGQLTPAHVLIYIAIWRIVLGIGVGGDYPMSSTVTSDRAVLRKRGVLLGYVFSFQGWGSLVGSVVSMTLLGIYKSAIEHKGSKVDGVWRLAVGLSLVPAFGTLYYRLKLPESTRYKKAKHVNDDDDSEADLKKERMSDDDSTKEEPHAQQGRLAQAAAEKKTHMKEFAEYFSEWRHLKLLIGTTASWFLVDIAFYGINLNQSVVLQAIGFAGKNESEWQSLFHIATGNLIITALGFVPGYYASIALVEYLGRKWIQLQGFVVTAVILAILAGLYHKLSVAGFVVLFALLQFFFNFGANTTTYLYPAEVFPTRVRATAHGISAACGKAGAIITALLFNRLAKSIGIPNVLWIFVGVSFAGVFSTLLLPEVKGRDPDVVDAEERRERHA